MVRRGLIAIALLALVGAAAANPLRISVPPNRDPQPLADPDDDFVETIEVGRLEVMVQQIAFLLHNPETKAGELDSALPIRLAAAMASSVCCFPKPANRGMYRQSIVRPIISKRSSHCSLARRWKMHSAVSIRSGRPSVRAIKRSV